jgi:Cof subfamily protein (haloacid dehalogenase superfamily)
VDKCKNEGVVGMKKKIVFFDIDGTLLDHDKNLPDSTREAVKTLQQNGVFVAIATGRAPFMFEYLRKELDIDSYVSFNGQYVVFENKVIYQNPMHTERLHDLMEMATKDRHPLVYLNEETMKANVEHHPFIEDSMASLKFTHPAFDADFYRQKDIFQSLLFCEDKDEFKYIKEFNNDFHFIRWHQYSTDIIPKGGSKAEGIKQMISKLGFKLEDVYAFGDGLNDIEMLNAVGTGVAMGNAADIVKQSADVITDDVGDNGLYKGLKSLHLI